MIWLLLLPTTILLGFCNSLEVDNNGYIMYCPCMGRFGNQFEHFLGALAFAKGLDRTLVLPPWVEFPIGSLQSQQVPFDKYFKVEPLRDYHKVITMEQFMKELAPTLWPPGQRISFCYMARQSLDKAGPENSCNAKDGNPFGPFWDTFNINFDSSEFYGPLYYDTWDPVSREQWHEKYPSDKYPVLAFTGAPGAFPVAEDNVPLTRYLFWSDSIESQADQFIKENLQDRPFLGLQLRIGSDFKRACEHIQHGRQLFASAQCLGYRHEYGQVTEELCLPSEKTILKQLKSTIKETKAKAVFVATDTPSIIDTIKKMLKDKVKVVFYTPANPHVELAILTKSDHYIASCVSTYSAVATRLRQSHKLGPTSFWAFNPRHDEL